MHLRENADVEALCMQYFPPDFDPAKLPKGKRPDHNMMKVRMMLPMSIRCGTCGTFLMKGMPCSYSCII
jgi:hypothetical protein